MNQHILLKNAYIYEEPKTIEYPKGYEFSDSKGYWINNKNGEALMMSKDKRRPQTKKEDRETGEDQKGE